MFPIEKSQKSTEAIEKSTKATKLKPKAAASSACNKRKSDYKQTKLKFKRQMVDEREVNVSHI